MTIQLSSGRSWCQNGQEGEEGSVHYTGSSATVSPDTHEYSGHCRPWLMCFPVRSCFLTPFGRTHRQTMPSSSEVMCRQINSCTLEASSAPATATDTERALTGRKSVCDAKYDSEDGKKNKTERNIKIRFSSQLSTTTKWLIMWRNCFGDPENGSEESEKLPIKPGKGVGSC